MLLLLKKDPGEGHTGGVGYMYICSATRGGFSLETLSIEVVCRYLAWALYHPEIS